MGQPWVEIAGGCKPLGGAAFSARAVFENPQIKPWRTLADRENCTWELKDGSGHSRRLHVKRYAARVARAEAAGYRALGQAGIATAGLVAWGGLGDGRGFLITEDLGGFRAADKMIDSREGFEAMLQGSAELVARLHRAGLHHRDLYLCHFFARPAAATVELCLIDAARVRRLPWFLRRRWVVKDLAQFWYSTLALPITDDQRLRWLEHYAGQRGIANVDRLARAVRRKAAWIGAHDLNLRRKQPGRNVSIPGEK